MAKKVVEVRGYAGVRIDQSRVKARVTIEIKGDETVTKEKLEDLVKRLTA